MYARVTSFRVDPSRLGELQGKIKELTPVARRLPGLIDMYAVWRADGQGVVTSIYQSKADADAAIARIQALWGTLADLLKAAPSTDAYDTVQHIVG